MNKNKHRIAAFAALLVLVVLGLAGTSHGQSAITGKETTPNAAPQPSTQTVNAQQAGAWNVGIDQARNTVQLSNTEANPLAVKVVGNGPARKPFQTRALLGPTAEAFSTIDVAIPTGKRLVIENISAYARIPDGLRAEVQVITYFDNDSDGVGGLEDMAFHRITLVDQGTFQGLAVATGNHKVQVFADSVIGAGQYPVTVQARLNAFTTSFAHVQVTISGYLEDLPTAQ